MSWTATTTCPYDQSVFDGAFTVERDTWQDYAIGDLVKVTPGPGENKITIFVYPSPAYGSNRKCVVLDVDGTTGNVTISKQVVGDCGADKDVTMKGSGAVNSCQGTITLTNITFRFGNSVYEGYELTLK